MPNDVTALDHIEVFVMIGAGELSLDKFKEWIDDLMNDSTENGYQIGFEEGQNQ